MKVTISILLGLCVTPVVYGQEWQIHARWCLSDGGSSGNAYRTTCTHSDQYDAVIACQRHNGEATATLQAAGRPAVNSFMAPLQPNSCRKPNTPPPVPPTPITTAKPTTQTTRPKIYFYVTNDGSWDSNYEIHDNVCNADKTIPVPAHGRYQLWLCSSGALSDGYASFKARRSGNTIWNNFDQIRQNETRSLN